MNHKTTDGLNLVQYFNFFTFLDDEGNSYFINSNIVVFNNIQFYKSKQYT